LKKWRGEKLSIFRKQHIEGGDVIVWDDFLFIGTCFSEDYRSYKTARTNEYAIEILKEYFPKKRIIDLELKKNDRIPYEGILHLIVHSILLEKINVLFTKTDL
jgi:N-dimethylarginine dimethylaminohydrolase